GMEDLGVLPGMVHSFAFAMNTDGSAIVGQSVPASGVNSRAVLWTRRTGLVDLGEFLARLGVDLSGWTFSKAIAISANGTAMTGGGLFHGEYRAWAVTGI